MRQRRELGMGWGPVRAVALGVSGRKQPEVLRLADRSRRRAVAVDRRYRCPRRASHARWAVGGADSLAGRAASWQSQFVVDGAAGASQAAFGIDFPRAKQRIRPSASLGHATL